MYSVLNLSITKQAFKEQNICYNIHSSMRVSNFILEMFSGCILIMNKNVIIPVFYN